MLKSRTSKRIFEEYPNFRKRYPRGEFWSRYEHHESTGLKDLRVSEEYIRKQQEHHQVRVIDDRLPKHPGSRRVSGKAGAKLSPEGKAALFCGRGTEKGRVYGRSPVRSFHIK